MKDQKCPQLREIQKFTSCKLVRQFHVLHFHVRHFQRPRRYERLSSDLQQQNYSDVINDFTLEMGVFRVLTRGVGNVEGVPAGSLRCKPFER